MMFVWALILVGSLTGCGESGKPEGAVSYEREPFATFQNFVGNWDVTKHPVLFAVVRTPEEYDRIFYPAGAMGVTRPYAPEPEFFNGRQILTVCRCLNELDEKDFAVESIQEVGDELFYRYRFRGQDLGAKGSFKMEFSVYIPRKKYSRVHFIENGKPLQVLDLKSGQWAVPPAHPSWQEQMKQGR
jgi:hypothetical protein